MSGVLTQRRAGRAEAGPRRLGDPAAAALADLTREAALSIGSVAALVSVLDDHGSFLRAEVGLPLEMIAGRETPLLDALCLLVAGRTEPLVVADSECHDEARVNRTLGRLAIRSCIGQPLLDLAGRPLGCFVVIGEGPRLWAADEVHLVRRLAAEAAAGTAPSGSWERDEPEPALLRAAVEEAIEDAGSLEEGLDEALQILATVLGWDVAGAWLVDEDGEWLSCRGYWHSPLRGPGAYAVICRALRFEGDQDMVGTAWTRRQPIWGPELPPGERFPRAGVARAAGLTCGAWIPLLAAGRSIGALELLAAEPTPLQARTVPQLIDLGRRIGECVARTAGAPRAWLGGANGPFRGLPEPELWRFGAAAPTIRPRT